MSWLDTWAGTQAEHSASTGSQGHSPFNAAVRTGAESGQDWAWARGSLAWLQASGSWAGTVPLLPCTTPVMHLVLGAVVLGGHLTAFQNLWCLLVESVWGQAPLPLFFVIFRQRHAGVTRAFALPPRHALPCCLEYGVARDN